MAGPQNAARRIDRLRAVVAKDAAPYVIGGVSAKSFRKRFDDAALEKLPVLRWWDWPEDRIARNIGARKSGRVDLLA